MLKTAIWRERLQQTAKHSPLRYVNGVRVPVCAGVCCHVHAHSAVEIVYHDRGHGRTRLPGRELDFTEGSVIMYAPELRHDQVMAVAGEDWCIQIALPSNYEFPECLEVPVVGEAWMLDEIRHLSRGHAVVSEREQAVLNLRATSLLLGLLHAASNGSRQEQLDPAEQHARSAEDYLRRYFASIQSLTEVARHVGVGADHLRHLFKSRRGISLVRCLNDLRITRAKALLANPALSLKQIATLCGYRDEYYFATVFRKLAGCPPGQYRRRVNVPAGRPLPPATA